MLKGLTDNDRAYMAGFFDAEGCVSFGIGSKHNKNSIGYTPAISLVVTANDKIGMENLFHYLGSGGVYESPSAPRFAKRPCYHLRIAKKSDILEIIEFLLPYSNVKKSQLILCKKTLNQLALYKPIERSKYSREAFEYYLKQKDIARLLKNRSFLYGKDSILCTSYLAGFFDGEGCISMNYSNKIYRTKKKGEHYHYTPAFSIHISSSRESILIAIQKYLGFGHIYRAKIRKLNKRPSYDLVISSKADLIAFVDKLLPFSQSKKSELSLLKETIITLTCRRGLRYKYLPDDFAYFDSQVAKLSEIRSVWSEKHKRVHQKNPNLIRA